MYLAYFGLREKPFNLTPDPKFLFLNANYREALAALRYGITERRGFVSLVGEAGSGKTTLLRCLLAELGPQVRSVLVLNPAVSFEELLSFILTDLGKPAAPGTPKLHLLQALNGELLDTLARGDNVVILIDEAQDLTISVLEELRLLSNLETANEKILQLVLAGQPEFDAMLIRPELRQLRQRIAVPVRLRPLARHELGPYVASRIHAAGGDPRGLFSRAALWRLWLFSRGLPRLVNVACDNALVNAYASGARRIGWRIMGEVTRDLRRGEVTAPTRLARASLMTVAIAAAIGAFLGLGASRLTGRATVGEPRAVAVGEPRALGEHVTTSAQGEGTDVARAAGAPRVESVPRVESAPPPPAVAHDMASAPQRAAPPPAAVNDTAPVVAPVPPPAAPRPADLMLARTALTPAARATERSVRPSRVPQVVAPPPAAVAVAPRPENVVPVVESPSIAPPSLPEPQPATERDAGEVLAPATGSVPPEGMRVQIVEGDDLTHIARRYYGYDSRELLAAIQEANPSLVDLDLVPAGYTLVLPPPPLVRPTLAEEAPAAASDVPTAATP